MDKTRRDGKGEIERRLDLRSSRISSTEDARASFELTQAEDLMMMSEDLMMMSEERV
jgi:hypothetical protein